MNLFIYKLEGPRLEGPRLEGPRLEGPRLEGPRLEGPRLEGPRVFCILTLPHASGKLCELHSEAGSHGRTPQGGWITWAHTTGGAGSHGCTPQGGWITWAHTTGGAGSHECTPQGGWITWVHTTGGLDHMGAHRSRSRAPSVAWSRDRRVGSGDPLGPQAMRLCVGSK